MPCWPLLASQKWSQLGLGPPPVPPGNVPTSSSHSPPTLRHYFCGKFALCPKPQCKKVLDSLAIQWKLQSGSQNWLGLQRCSLNPIHLPSRYSELSKAQGFAKGRLAKRWWGTDLGSPRCAGGIRAFFSSHSGNSQPWKTVGPGRPLLQWLTSWCHGCHWKNQTWSKELSTTMLRPLGNGIWEASQAQWQPWKASIYIVVQLSPPSISRTFHLSKLKLHTHYLFSLPPAPGNHSPIFSL